MIKPLDKHQPERFSNRFLTRNHVLKYHIQEWLDTIVFGLNITIEPTPYSPIVDDEVRQRLRQVEMNINRKFIGNKFSSFKNWTDRFWYIGFFEGKGRWRHVHVLLHIPFQMMKPVINNTYWRMAVSQTFISEWIRLPSINYLGRKKDSPIPYIQQLKKKQNSVRCSRYDSKKLNHKDNYDDFFFSAM